MIRPLLLSRPPLLSRPDPMADGCGKAFEAALRHLADGWPNHCVVCGSAT